MKVEICFSPALYEYYAEDNNKIVVVVDIFRASTTMCAAFQNGVKAIIPVASVEEAKDYKAKGYLVGAERNVKRCDFADFGNSPNEYSAEKVKDRELVFSTTNGTQAIKIAEDCDSLIIGSFSNLQATAEYCIVKQKDVIVLCAGWNNRFNIEDSLYAGALVDILSEEGNYSINFDATLIALEMWKTAKSDLRNYIDRAEHVKRLEANDLLDVIDYCLTVDTVNLVPVYNKNTGKLTL